MNGDAVEAAIELAGILESIGARYLIGGSLASTVWAEPRFTQDVDLISDLALDQVPDLLGHLGESWYADEVLIREAIATHASFNVIRLAGMVKIDVFLPRNEGLHASKWGRARVANLGPDGGGALRVTSPEDILLQKLDWFRSGGGVSEQQWRDVTTLLRVRGDRLEDEYLNTWARTLELEELLGRARAEARGD
ncbi:MAG: hypothetical protein O2816_14885 [Planctomycetota bacterium]|nr:hypothetical protein [Planctomycetota bacterium]